MHFIHSKNSRLLINKYDCERKDLKYFKNTPAGKNTLYDINTFIYLFFLEREKKDILVCPVSFKMRKMKGGITYETVTCFSILDGHEIKNDSMQIKATMKIEGHV